MFVLEYIRVCIIHHIPFDDGGFLFKVFYCKGSFTINEPKNVYFYNAYMGFVYSENPETQTNEFLHDVWTHFILFFSQKAFYTVS